VLIAANGTTGINVVNKSTEAPVGAETVKTASEVIALLLSTNAETGVGIEAVLADYVVEELVEVAMDEKLDQDRRVFAAMAVCRILNNISFHPPGVIEIK
jgi:hypothetical protein